MSHLLQGGRFQTACKHVFCRECAYTWFETSSTCPSFRSVLYGKEDRWMKARRPSQRGVIGSSFSSTLQPYRGGAFFYRGWRTIQSVLEHVDDIVGYFIPFFAESEATELLKGMLDDVIRLRAEGIRHEGLNRMLSVRFASVHRSSRGSGVGCWRNLLDTRGGHEQSQRGGPAVDA